MFTKLLPLLLKGLDRFCATLAILALTGIAGVVLLQVISRFLLPSAPVWTEEASRYLFIYLVAVSAGLVMRHGLFVSLDLFQHRLGAKGRAIYRLLVCLTVGGFSLVTLPYDWQFAAVGQWQTSPTLIIPMNYIYSAMTVMFGLVALYSLIGILEALAELVGGKR